MSGRHPNEPAIAAAFWGVVRKWRDRHPATESGYKAYDELNVLIADYARLKAAEQLPHVRPGDRLSFVDEQGMRIAGTVTDVGRDKVLVQTERGLMAVDIAAVTCVSGE